MIEKSLLFEILRDQNSWHKTPKFQYIDRNEYLEQIEKYLPSKSILILQGPRRSGKTVLLKLFIKDMMEYINKNYILYVNLEDYRLVQYYSLELLEKIYDVYREHVNPRNEMYYIIDEIQNIDGFEHFLRTKYDNEERIKFIITGSNAKLLSKELASLLTGRTLSFEIFPFSFKEYLNYQKVEVEDNSYYALESRKHELKHLFNHYCNNGAIPEYLDDPVKERLEEYFENVILKDVVERYNIRNAKLFKELGIYLLSNASTLTSYNSLSKTFGVSINTIKEYISYLEAAYLFFSVTSFSFSYKKHVTVPSKVYCIDNGLINLVSFKFIENRGKLFENLVFLELNRSKKEIYYHSDKKECDFILKDKLKISSSIQVTVSIQDEKTKKRELDGLLDAIKKYDLNEGLILTEDEYNDYEIDGSKIKVRPIWFWLLNKED